MADLQGTSTQIIQQLLSGIESAAVPTIQLTELSDLLERQQVQDKDLPAVTRTLLRTIAALSDGEQPAPKVSAADSCMQILIGLLDHVGQRWTDNLVSTHSEIVTCLVGSIERGLRRVDLQDDPLKIWELVKRPFGMLCLYNDNVEPHASITEQLDPVVPDTLLRVSTLLFLFHSRNIELYPDFTSGFYHSMNPWEMFNSTLHNYFEPDHMNEDNPAFVQLLESIPDVASICYSNISRYQETPSRIPYTFILATFSMLHIIYDFCPAHRQWLIHHDRLVPIIVKSFRWLLASHPRRHAPRTEKQGSSWFLSDNFDLIPGSLIRFVVSADDDGLRLAQAFNSGLWSICRRMLLLGQCKCELDKDILSRPPICPWSINSTSLEERQLCHGFLRAVSVTVLGKLAAGYLPLFRQLEKGMRRSAYEEARAEGNLPFARHKEWDANVVLISLVLEKRRLYNEIPRKYVCVNYFECPQKENRPKDLLVCSRCYVYYYCSKECQRKSWNLHHKQDNCETWMAQNSTYPTRLSPLDKGFSLWLQKECGDVFGTIERQCNDYYQEGSMLS